jgi:hypothetical protein
MHKSNTADGDLSAHHLSARVAASRGDDLNPPESRIRVWEYVCAELGLSVGAREDDPDMAVARERVFDIIYYIPLEFERLQLYGGLLCADAVLGVVTSLPVRVACQTARLLFAPWAAVVETLGLTPVKGGGQGGANPSADRAARGGSLRSGSGAIASLKKGSSVRSKRQSWGFHPYAREHLSDSLWLLMLLCAVAAVGSVDVSVLYHYIRGQEVIKLYLACSVLECFDKLCCAFNCHVLDALQNSVYIVVQTAAGGDLGPGSASSSASVSSLPHAALQLAFDAALTAAVTTAHAFIMLAHATTLSVAINSHTNAMLLVLVSNNFAEIKGHVFKKMDEGKVFTAARMDIVERVHLSVCLLFVGAQRVTAAGSVAGGLTRKMLADSLMVLGSEVGVDVFKHAFMSKFNALRPKVYRGFFRQLCREHVKLAQSYKLHRVVGFVPLAPAAVLIKALPGVYRTLTPETAAGAFDDFADDASSAGSGSGSFLAELGFARIARHLANPLGTRSGRELVGFALAFLALLAFKLAFGVALHWFGARTLERLRRQGKGARRGRAEGATEGPADAAADADRANPWRNPNTRAMFGPKPGTVDGTSKTFEDADSRGEGDGRRGNENGRDGNGGREWNGFNGNGNERGLEDGRRGGSRGEREGSPARGEREEPETPGSPHYKLHPEYRAGV